MAKFKSTYYKKSDIVLLAMPGTLVFRPSLSLSILKASLLNTPYKTDILYANIFFQKEINEYSKLWNISQQRRLIQEWVFSKILFPDYVINDDDYLNEHATDFLIEIKEQVSDENIRKCVNNFKEIRNKAAIFLDSLADIIIQKNPRIVGCSSNFIQHISSLTILKRIKEIKPEIITIMGGANCSGEMGVTTILEFPFVDYIFSGEADETFPIFVSKVFSKPNKQNLDLLPPSIINSERAAIISNTINGCNNVPFAQVKNLNILPIPDFSDYYSTYSDYKELSIFNESNIKAIPLEASRGCWWFEKVGCTFCGLNPGDRKYRSKSPQKIINEMNSIASLYGTNIFTFSDNMLNMDSFDEFIHLLKSVNTNYKLSFGIGANPTMKQVKMLSEAKILVVQPGIESLHDEVLKLMKKGTTAIKNVQLLKYATEFGIRLLWSMMFNFPGDNKQWYTEMSTWLYLLTHLQPPKMVNSIVFQRFSEYYHNAKKYNLTLIPAKDYKFVYPFKKRILSQLVYNFEDINQKDFSNSSSYKNINQAVESWRNEYFNKKAKPILQMKKNGDEILITDTRSCAVRKYFVLKGNNALLYDNCDPAISKNQLYSKFENKISVKEIDKIINELIKRNLLLNISNKYLSLAISSSNHEK
jgi:magnesium-protoporphyrin IX monomethyl ester (oxidative) cyclase